MLHVQPNTATISPEPPTDCIPKWSLEQEQHPNDSALEQDPVSPPGPPALTEDDDYFFLNQPPPPPPPIPPCMLSASQQEHYYTDEEQHEVMDDKYETATRIFYATMQKFAGPSSHRRTFLESWHLHSMYSKSQQILLGIPNAQSMVYLSGDDFMFTPQLVPQDTTMMMDQMEFDWEEDEEEDEEDEEFPPMMTMKQEEASSATASKENDVMIMSAPAPVMDENLWMAPDKDLSGFSLDAVDLYRHGSPSPPPPELDSNEKGKEILRPSQEQEIMKEKEQDKTILLQQQQQSSPSYYGTVVQRDIVQQPNGSSVDDDMTERLLQWPILHASERLAHDLLLAFELAQDFVDNNKKGLRTVSSFFVYLIRIWHVLFVCAEMMLGHLGTRRRPLMMNDELV